MSLHVRKHFELLYFPLLMWCLEMKINIRKSSFCSYRRLLLQLLFEYQILPQLLHNRLHNVLQMYLGISHLHSAYIMNLCNYTATPMFGYITITSDIQLNSSAIGTNNELYIGTPTHSVGLLGTIRVTWKQSHNNY